MGQSGSGWSGWGRVVLLTLILSYVACLSLFSWRPHGPLLNICLYCPRPCCPSSLSIFCVHSAHRLSGGGCTTLCVGLGTWGGVKPRLEVGQGGSKSQMSPVSHKSHAISCQLLFAPQSAVLWPGSSCGLCGLWPVTQAVAYAAHTSLAHLLISHVLCLYPFRPCLLPFPCWHRRIFTLPLPPLRRWPRSTSAHATSTSEIYCCNGRNAFSSFYLSSRAFILFALRLKAVCI